MFVITSLYAGLLGLLFLTLSYRVIFYRRGKLISLGDHGDKALETRIRAQANCAEYAPLGLILLALTESTGAPGLAVHCLGLMLFAGRLFHGISFWGERPTMPLRVAGMVLTTLMIAASALGLIAHGLF